MNHEIKKYSEKEIPFEIISETFKASFHKDLEKEYWEWRFLTNPNDKKKYIHYITDNEKLAAYYAVSPNTLILKDGQTFKVALSNMTMTHPEYQGHGFFSKIAKSLFEELKENGYKAVYGFANHNSHYGFRKNLGWIDLFALNSFKLEQNDLKKKNNKSIFNFKISELTEDHLQNTTTMICSENYISLTRDVDNLRWRLLNNPSVKYQSLEVYKDNTLCLMIFFKFFGEIEIDVLELFFMKDPRENKNILLFEAFQFLIESYRKNLNIWSNLNSDEHLYLESIGFKETSFSTYFGVIPLTDDRLINSYITNNRLWHFRFFDSDIY